MGSLKRAWSQPCYSLYPCLIIFSKGHDTYISGFKSIQLVSTGSVPGYMPILSCYVLQPQQRRHRDWMPPSLCQKPVVSSTILVFQKYGLPGRCGATGRAGRAQWHSWFPVLWTDYCCLFPTACSYSEFYFIETSNFAFMTDKNLFESVSHTCRLICSINCVVDIFLSLQKLMKLFRPFIQLQKEMVRSKNETIIKIWNMTCGKI